MKTTNEYSQLISESMPKSVAQAIALSFALRLNEDDFDRAIAEVYAEWGALHNGGIVPQPVPARLRPQQEAQDHDR